MRRNPVKTEYLISDNSMPLSIAPTAEMAVKQVENLVEYICWNESTTVAEKREMTKYGDMSVLFANGHDIRVRAVERISTIKAFASRFGTAPKEE
jgi:hypothetical protein